MVRRFTVGRCDRYKSDKWRPSYHETVARTVNEQIRLTGVQ